MTREELRLDRGSCSSVPDESEEVDAPPNFLQEYLQWAIGEVHDLCGPTEVEVRRFITQQDDYDEHRYASAFAFVSPARRWEE